jgi:pimeloyl-ACP methyl ester carboxylesterase/predicted glycosyltransferase
VSSGERVRRTGLGPPPDLVGHAERDGVRLAYKVFGNSGPAEVTVLLLPTWQIIDSRFWRAQVGFLARHYRVITFDARGSGESDRPLGAAAYTNTECAADVLAVLDATGTDRAVLVSMSCGATWAVHAAADHPDRVSGLVAIAPACGLGVAEPERDAFAWDVRPETTAGWAKYNKYNWLEGDLDDFHRFFFAKMCNEPHSTKQIEDCLDWAAPTGAQVLVDTTTARLGLDGVHCEPLEPVCSRVRCPVLVIHGTEDKIRPSAIGTRLAELTNGSLVLMEGAGHAPSSRHPVRVNLLLKEFVDRVQPRPTTTRWSRSVRRSKRALFLSSPIGLGHTRRDLAVAAELRRLQPDLQIDWLAQHPTTALLESSMPESGSPESGSLGSGSLGSGSRESGVGRVHPASAALASESDHIEAEAGEHDLHAFQAIRRMDEILINNFMVFEEVVREEHYDLVIGDEAWDVDYFLHENPELKRFAFAWMTDFVGWLPMPDGGAREERLTADYNAEMLEQRARFRRVRDRSIYVGNPDDVVDLSFGPGLPGIRPWTEENFDFAGYVTGFDPAEFADRERLRAELGYRPDEKVCLVTVGGSGVGEPLLRRILAAVPVVRKVLPELRFVLVTGPRIVPESLPAAEGATVLGYRPDLHRHLAACDLAVVQGGLTTCMELTALGRPFIYVPLRQHFEQNLHVPHRLSRYQAGTRMSFDDVVDPDALAAAIGKELAQQPAYRPVETDGAARAAALLASLL